mgnify:CR=1 FL=1
MGKYQKNIEAARRITVMQYLETYHPGELVRKTDREYCTRTHDSLIITPANGFFHWFSRNVGGNNAIDYLTKVEGMDFVSAVRLLNEMAHARGQTMAQMALSWLLKDERVTSVLIGASRPEQLEENVQALNNLRFSEDELMRIDQHVADGELNLWQASSDK